MKNTKSELHAHEVAYLYEDGSFETRVHIDFSAEMVLEDWLEFEKHCDYFNEHSKTDNDMGDNMLALLTYAIHQMHETRTGEPWVLRMDRKPN